MSIQKISRRFIAMLLAIGVSGTTLSFPPPSEGIALGGLVVDAKSGGPIIFSDVAR